MNHIALQDVYDRGRPRAGSMEWLYELMKERDPEINISHRELPTFEQHRQFVTRRPFRLWYLIERRAPEWGNHINGEWLGYVSATHRNEIGIVLRKSARGQGIGPQALRMFMAAHEPLEAAPGERNGRWLANIAPTNQHSKHVFEKLGFLKIQETFALGGG